MAENFMLCGIARRGTGSNDSKERVKGKRHRPASAIIHPSLIIALALHAYLFAPSLHLSSRILSPARKPPHPHTYVQHLIQMNVSSFLVRTIILYFAMSQVCFLSNLSKQSSCSVAMPRLSLVRPEYNLGRVASG